MPRAPYGLTFETFSPVERSQHLRADVALFVGFVAPRREAAPRESADERAIRDWLGQRGFGDRAAALDQGPTRRSVATLTQVPLPLDSWETFDRLFAWDARPVAGPVAATTYLGAAVRAFFAQGGRRAYVVRAGDPWPLRHAPEDTSERARLRGARLWSLVPGAAPRPDGEPAPTPFDRSTWRGITHLFGLEDVSFVLLPDLPDLLDAAPAPTPPPRRAREEVFVTCGDERAEAPATDSLLAAVPPPACDELTLGQWVQAIAAAAAFLKQHRREALLLAALPLLLQGPDGVARLSAENPLARLYAGRWLGARREGPGAPRPDCEDFTSAFVQIATPWLKTTGSARCPGEVEPPDGTLAGLLARNARARGTFRSAAGVEVPHTYDLLPAYGRAALLEPIPAADRREPQTLLQRLTVFGRAPRGIELLSDVTTSADEAYRPAGASRLIGAVLRAARAIGEDLSFEPSNELLWARVRQRFEAMMKQLWAAEALRGSSPAEAFQVRCDRATISQADLDAGRVIVEVQMEVAAAIESIRVTLALSEGGRVEQLAAGGAP